MVYYEYGTTTNKLSFPRGWVSLRVAKHNEDYSSIITYTRRLTDEECDSIGLKLVQILGNCEDVDKLIEKTSINQIKTKRIKNKGRL